jgi:thiosulfate/3-mercaptopyruvate sulfurtransferase
MTLSAHSTLITAEVLQRHLHDPAWRVIDVRHDLADPAAGRRAYDAGHLPGALFASLDDDLSGEPQWRTTPGGQRHNGGRHPLPEREALRQRLQALGIGDDTQVVAYDAHGGMFAARLWWLLRWLGHERVAVLDGGLPAWQAAGLPLSTDVPAAPTPGRLTERASLETLVDLDTVFGNLTTRRLQVVDARAPDRFRGENETLDPVGGHIPGAVNRFFKDNLQPDGRFKPADVLRAEWTALLPEPTRGIAQCGSGVTACHNLLALAHAGLPGVGLYAGSWSDWVSDPGRPVATGAV